MKFNTIILIKLLLIGIFILTTLTQSIKAEPTDTLLDNQHYLIVGHIYELYDNDSIVLINVQTNEEILVNIQNCDHGLKEYLFDLANLKKEWNNGDKLLLIYDNQTKKLIIDNSEIGIQADINKPANLTPITIIGGTILILTSGGYYYIRKKKQTKEIKIIKGDEIMEGETAKTEVVSVAERVSVILIFGTLAAVSMYKNNFEAASGFASTIAVYFLSRTGT